MEAIKQEGLYQFFDFKLSHRVLTIRYSFLIEDQYYNSDVQFIAVQYMNIRVDLGSILIRLATKEELEDLAEKGLLKPDYFKFFKIFIIESTNELLKQDYYVIASQVKVREKYLAPIPLE